MIFRILTGMLVAFFSSVGYGQTGRPHEADYYLKVLRNSKDTLYQKILKEYENYLIDHPEDIATNIEKCKLIEVALYDEYNEYNPNEEAFEKCVQELLSDFPNHQEVLLYQLENTWGDSSISLCQRILAMNRKSPGSWPDWRLSIVYNKLAEQYQYYGTPTEVIESAHLAQDLNDTLDLTFLLASQYAELNQYSKAGDLLLSKLDSTDLGSELRNKGNLLLELGYEKEALMALRYASKDPNIYIDNGKIAEALIGNQKFDEARDYLIKDLENSYGRSTTLHNLFVFDYEHSPTDSILNTYRALMSEGFSNDAFGKYRAMMLFKAPLQGWSWMDPLKIVLLVLLVAAFIVFPYLWILPIHFVSQRFGIRSDRISLSNARWGLTDFWLVASGLLLIEVFAWILFNYPDLLSTFFGEIYFPEENRISPTQANRSLFYFSCVLVFVLGYLKKTDYFLMKPVNWKLGKSLGLGVLNAFLLRSIYFGLARNGILPGYETTSMSSVVDSLKSINLYYHPSVTFLFAVILIPFYEEYIFRGIILNSVEGKLKFIAANCVQAFFFALVHDNLQLFLFYFLFGIIAGSMVKKSGSIAPGIAFHMTNNLFAFIAIMRM